MAIKATAKKLETVKKASNLTRKPLKIRSGARAYNAGEYGRLYGSWQSWNESVSQVIYRELPVLRTRSREQSQNNDYVKRLIQITQNNVIGDNGIKFRSLVVDYDGRPDNLVRTAIEKEWKKWCDVNGPCLDSCMSLIDIQHLIMSAMVTDGEVFCLKVKDAGQQFKLQLIDPVLIDIEYNSENNKIRMGIEYDDYHKPVAYYLNKDYRNYHPGVGYTESYNVPRVRIPAKEMIHLYRVDRVNQERGIPWIANSLTRLRTLGKYEEAALINAQIGASKMGFFRDDNNGEYKGDTEKYSIQCEPGTFENIGNRQFLEFNPTYPDTQYDSFVTRILKGISSGMGVDYHTIGNDASDVNYSSARVAMLETREYWTTLQTWLIRHFIKPVFNEWLGHCILFDKIKVINRKGYEIPLNRSLDYYTPAFFQGRRWDWVDPLKEMNARKMAYEMNITSLSQIIRDQGRDPDEVFTEIKEEQEKLKTMGLSMTNSGVISNESEINDTE